MNYVDSMTIGSKKRPRRMLSIEDDGTRKVTLMSKINSIKILGLKVQVEFDDKDQPKGSKGDELLSYIGVLAREHVPIWINDWRSKELNQVKDRIWDEVCGGFNVPRTFKSDCLMRAGEMARGFRHDLHAAFVKDNINAQKTLERPPSVVKFYTYIIDKDWKKYVNYRQTEDFKSCSQQKKKAQEKCIYNSRGGRNGYRKLDQELVSFYYGLMH